VVCFSQVLQELPVKEEVVERVAMAYEQQELYDELKQTFVKTITEDGKQLNVLKGGQGSMMMMMLRKVRVFLLSQVCFYEMFSGGKDG